MHCFLITSLRFRVNERSPLPGATAKSAFTTASQQFHCKYMENLNQRRRDRRAAPFCVTAKYEISTQIAVSQHIASERGNQNNRIHSYQSFGGEGGRSALYSLWRSFFTKVNVDYSGRTYRI